MEQLFRIAMIGCVLSACSDEGTNFGPESSPTPAQQSAITMNMDYLSQIASADVPGESAATAALGFAFGAPALLGIESVARAVPGLPAAADGCAVLTDHSVTWTHCRDGDTTIDGTMSWGPGHVDMNIGATAIVGASQLRYGFVGSMTASDTAIDADMTVSFSITGGGSTASDMIRTLVDVELAAGCIDSGTLTVIEMGTGTGTRNRAIQVVWSGCNMFRVRNG
jgi:hypothetical protein